MTTIGERKNVGTGLQEFILDPKSSVKKYLENSIAANSEGTANNQTPKYNPQNPQQQGNGNWNQPGGSGPNFQNPNNLTPQIPQGGVPQRPASAQSNNSFNPPPQNYQSPPPQQYTPQPSNVGPHPNEPQNYGAPPQQPAPYTNYAQPQPIKNDFQNLKQDLSQLGQGIQAMNPFSDQNQHNAPYPPSAYAQQQAPLFGGAAPLQDQRHIGPAPPPPEQQAYAQALPASRLYHRMICDYETIKSIFYAAKMQPVHNDLSPLASKLKNLSRDIWTLRYTRSAEFSYNEAANEERITEWKAVFEYWSDILTDMLDPAYLKMQELADKEADWPKVAGITAAKAPAKKVVVAAAPAAPATDEAAPVVKKKVVKKAAAADGEAAPVVKKKVPKKISA